MSGAEILPILTATGALAGGGAQIASASKGQQPGLMTPGAGPQLPSADMNMSQLGQVARMPQIQTFVPQSPQAFVPSVGDYDRNLMSILQSLGQR